MNIINIKKKNKNKMFENKNIKNGVDAKLFVYEENAINISGKQINLQNIIKSFLKIMILIILIVFLLTLKVILKDIQGVLKNLKK